MIDPDLRAKVRQLSKQTAQKTTNIDLSELWRRLEQVNFEEVMSRLEELTWLHWHGCLPTWEPPSIRIVANEQPVAVSGIDGSQIYPDHHSPVKWGYIQTVGYSIGSKIRFASDFIDLDEMAFDSLDQPNGGMITPEYISQVDYVNSKRTILEMKMVSEMLKEDPSKLYLLDNPLLPWLSGKRDFRNGLIQEYLYLLKETSSGLISGVISGPQSRLIVNLIALFDSASLSDVQNKWPGITDAMLVGSQLKPGERTALFSYYKPLNQIFNENCASIYFFFLKINDFEVARVEIPEWICKKDDNIAKVQASILADSRLLGYSYVLSAAHHAVTIPLEVGEQLRQYAISVYIENKGYYFLPAKLRMKAAFT